MKTCVAIVIAAMLAGGCASGGGESRADGQSRAMARLKEPVRAAAEGYISVMDELTRTLAGVTDTAGAKQAMPKIEELLAKLGEHWRTLDSAGPSARAEAKYAFWQKLDTAQQNFDAQAGRIKGTPGVGPALAGLLDKVQLWR